MTNVQDSSGVFDLTPHPRILPMLGEIHLQQWRCLAELIDNSVDSFLEAQRVGSPVQSPQVIITIPTGSSSAGTLKVRDNGPGMDSETLERAARAGWTSHDPINNLGLFGMGFNIATARLGRRTTIWTTREGDPEWVGLGIDFEELAKNKSFVSPALTRPKQDNEQSGTEVVIEALKPDQIDWFRKSYNRSNTSAKLGRTYSSMLGPAQSPVGFRLEINGKRVPPKLHCIWGGPGNPERTVETTRHGTVDAFQPFDKRLKPRPFCTQCWNWLGVGQDSCPSCDVEGNVVQRERRVHGWLGVQRYLDRNDFGIDILRNGRKIEIGSKDLFSWIDEDTDTVVTEYPIDDLRDRGRIVGEIHLDHCQVPYTKDRFVQEDAAWSEMVEIVRGNTPLRPESASRLGGGENTSPLFRLFQAFRRSNPVRKRSGGWDRILVVPDNDRAQAMAKRFDKGESEYQTDEQWWELIEEAQAEVLLGGAGQATTGAVLGDDIGDKGGEVLGEISVDVPTTQDETPNGDETTAPPPRARIASLSGRYVDDLTSQRFEIAAYSVAVDDPALSGTQSPWIMVKTTAGPWEFLIDTSAKVFRSMTLTPLDALLFQIAWAISDYERSNGDTWSIGAILSSLRNKYATVSFLDPRDLVAEASAQLVESARSIVGRTPSEEPRTFFENLSPGRQESVRSAMASRGVVNPHGAIDDGRFLEYSPPSIISDFILSNPELFFDGNYWDDPYSALDYGSGTATDDAKSQVLDYYGGLLADTVWLARQSPNDISDLSRERLMRASLATALLAPTAATGDTE